MNWLIKVDLAGVRPEDIQVRLEGRRISISGTRRDSVISEGCQAYSMEISYSRFERTFELPCELTLAKIQTEYREGMFLLSIRCQEENR
jgi:HSP20 family protein